MPSEHKSDLESPELLREQIQQTSETIAYLSEKLDFLMKQLQKNTALVGSLERALSKDAELEEMSHTANHSKLPVANSKYTSPNNSSSTAKSSRLQRYGKSRVGFSTALLTPLGKVHEPSTVLDSIKRDSSKSSLTPMRVGASARSQRVQSPLSHDESDEGMLQSRNKMKKPSESAANLRSTLALKTAELNELVAQLQLAYDALESVEKIAEGIEATLTELNSDAKTETAGKTELPQHQDGIKILCSDQHATKIHARVEPAHEQINQSLLQLEKLIAELGLDRDAYMKNFGDTYNIWTIRKSAMHLRIAKTIQISAWNNLKRRTNLLNGPRRDKELQEILTLGKKVRESVLLWKDYTHGSSLIIGGVNILGHLDNEDDSLKKCLPSVAEQANLSITSDDFVNMRPSTSSTLSSRIPRPSSSKSPPAIIRHKNLVRSTSETTAKVASTVHKLSVTTHPARKTAVQSHAADAAASKSLSPIETKDLNAVPAVAGKKIAKKISYSQLPQMSGKKSFPIPRISESRGGRRAVASRG